MYCSSVRPSAPTNRRPFTKIVGVLLTSNCKPLARLASTAAVASGPAMHDLNAPASSPACPAKSVIFVFLHGGPSQIENLYTRAMLEEAFSGFRNMKIVEQELEMHEGSAHGGMSAVINFTAWK